MKKADMIARIIALKPCYEDSTIEAFFADAPAELSELDVLEGAIKAEVPARDVVWLGVRLLPLPLVVRFAQQAAERAKACAAANATAYAAATHAAYAAANAAYAAAHAATNAAYAACAAAHAATNAAYAAANAANAANAAYAADAAANAAYAAATAAADADATRTAAAAYAAERRRQLNGLVALAVEHCA